MPTYLITAPDGKKFRVTGNGTKEEALAQIQSRYSQPKQEAAPDPSAGGGEFRPFGIDTGIQTPQWLDRGLAGAGKAFSDTWRGAKQVNDRLEAAQVAHPGMPMAMAAMMPNDSAPAQAAQMGAAQENADVRQQDAPLMRTGMGKAGNFAGNMALAAPTAFVPGANTITGSALIGGGLGLLQPADSDTQRLTNTGLGAGLGAASQWAGGKVMDVAANKLGARQAAADLAGSQNSARDAMLKQGMDAGFVAPPSTTNPSTTNRALESIAGKAATQGEASIKNQAVTNQLVRDELGIAADKPITREALKSVRTQAGKAYEAVKDSGQIIADDQYLNDVVDLLGQNSEVSAAFPGSNFTADKSVSDLADSLLQEKFSAKAAVEAAKRLRSQSKTNFQSAYAGGGSPEKLALAKAQWDAAGALEDVIQRHLTRQGKEGLAAQFNAARIQIAKSYSAEAALNEGTGNIVAGKLVTQLRKGKPLSGGFEKIAKFASAVPKAMTEPTQSSGVSALNAVLAGGSVGLGHPGLLALPAARLAARKAILSGAMNPRMATPNYTPGMLGNGALQIGRGLGATATPLSLAYAAQQ